MVRTLLATDKPSDDDVARFKYMAVAICYVVTLLSGHVAFKMMMMWRGERKKVIRTGTRLFAAGVCLGTAMMDLLRDADVTFLGMGRKYPLAFLLSCIGYGAAMLADCLLARAVRGIGRDCSTDPSLLDKIIFSFVSDVQPIKCCDASSPVVPSKSETKDCDALGSYTRDLLLHRLTVLGDSIVVAVTFGLLSMPGGNNIWNAKTITMTSTAFVSATLQNVIYAATLVFIMLRTIQMIPYIESLLFVLGTSGTPYSFSFDYVFLSENKGLLGGSGASEAAWSGGIFSGFFSGILVYIAVHHLLSGKSGSQNRLGKILLLFSGVGVIGLLKFLST